MDPLYFAQNCTIGHCNPFRHFFLVWTDLMDPPWYMEVAMEKGARNYLRLVFGVGRTHVAAGRMQVTVGRTLVSKGEN